MADQTDDAAFAAATCPHMPLDAGVTHAVWVLMENGVETFESCDAAHPDAAFTEPTVRFHGEADEGWRAFALARRYVLRVKDLRRVWPIVDGEPTGPWWEMTFWPSPSRAVVPREGASREVRGAETVLLGPDSAGGARAAT